MLIEAICRACDNLRHVSILWQPGHSGAAAGSMADAVAKSWLGGQHERGVMQRIARNTRGRKLGYEELVARAAGEQEITDDAASEEGEWELIDEPRFGAVRRRGAEYCRTRLNDGHQPARTRAGVTGRISEDTAKATIAAVPYKEVTDATDVQGRNDAVAVSMAARERNMSALGVAHEREWERQMVREGEAAERARRSGDYGCMACRRIRMARAQARRDRGEEEREEDRVDVDTKLPLATAAHILCGECEAVSEAQMGKLQKATADLDETAWKVAAQRRHARAKRGEDMEKDDAYEWRDITRQARKAAHACRWGSAPQDAWCGGMYKVLAGMAPEAEMEKDRSYDSSGKGRKERHQLRVGQIAQVVNAAAGAVQEHLQAAAPGVAWLRQREEHRPWLELYLDAWRRWRRSTVHAPSDGDHGDAEATAQSRPSRKKRGKACMRPTQAVRMPQMDKETRATLVLLGRRRAAQALRLVWLWKQKAKTQTPTAGPSNAPAAVALASDTTPTGYDVCEGARSAWSVCRGCKRRIEKGADRYARIVAGQRMWYHGGCWPQAAVDAEIERLRPTPKTNTGRPTRTQQTIPVYVEKKNKRQRLDGEGRLAEHASTTDCTQLGTRILCGTTQMESVANGGGEHPHGGHGM